LVEDDEDVREYTRAALAALGYRVLEAGEAIAALRVLEDHPQVAVLLTDVGLPGMNGNRLAQEARSRSPTLKILYTTGYARNAKLTGKGDGHAAKQLRQALAGLSADARWWRHRHGVG
jgi:CheY-like chemotaxis protein